MAAHVEHAMSKVQGWEYRLSWHPCNYTCETSWRYKHYNESETNHQNRRLQALKGLWYKLEVQQSFFSLRSIPNASERNAVDTSLPSAAMVVQRTTEAEPQQKYQPKPAIN